MGEKENKAELALLSKEGKKLYQKAQLDSIIFSSCWTITGFLGGTLVAEMLNSAKIQSPRLKNNLKGSILLIIGGGIAYAKGFREATFRFRRDVAKILEDEKNILDKKTTEIKTESNKK